MKSRRRVKENLKTALIILLIISAVFLGAGTGLFSGMLGKSAVLTALFGRRTGRNLPLAPVLQSASGEAAMPLFASVTGEEGTHFAVKYSSSGIRAVFDDTGTVLGEALGSASAERSIDEKAFQKALGLPGVYFDYLNPVPLPTLSSWLGVHSPASMDARVIRRLCVAVNGDMVELFYRDEVTEGYFCCTTAVQSGAVMELPGEYPPNGAVFAFENTDYYSGADKYTLIMQSTDAVFEYASTNPVPVVAGEEEIVSAFGINPYSGYSETDGTRVFVETDCSLRISPDGRVSYTCGRRASSRLGFEYSDMTGAVECARGFVQDTLGRSCGSAEIYLTSAEQVEGGYVLRFSYFLDSMPVYLPLGSCAAEITLKDGRVDSAELNFRSYSRLEEQNDILPDDISAAAMKNGGEPILCYVDSGTDSVRAGWIIY